MASRRQRKGKKQKSKSKAEKQPELVEKPVEKKKTTIREFYEQKYKQLLIIPFAMLIIAFIIIGFQVVTTGDFVDKDVSLKGGLTVTVLTKDVTVDDIEAYIASEFPDSDSRVRELSELGSQVGLIIDASDIEQSVLVDSLAKKIPGFRDNYSAETIGPALGGSFFKQTMLAIFMAFIFMSLVVFYYFRTLVPSGAVVLAAFSDIVVTIAVMNIIGMRLSTAGIAALLMLIGYSVDTDILLSTRVLKRKEGNVLDRMIGAIKTGLTMNFTTMAAIITAMVVSQSEIISQIMTILLIGLIIDIINTWIQNVGILRYYVAKKGIK
ncbi:protein translocase subunit SecF [Nanoarchaeota archaeon]